MTNLKIFLRIFFGKKIFFKKFFVHFSLRKFLGLRKILWKKIFVKKFFVHFSLRKFLGLRKIRAIFSPICFSYKCKRTCNSTYTAPPKNKYPTLRVFRLVQAPPCGCSALRVFRLAGVPPCGCSAFTGCTAFTGASVNDMCNKLFLKIL